MIDTHYLDYSYWYEVIIMANTNNLVAQFVVPLGEHDNIEDLMRL